MTNGRILEYVIKFIKKDFKLHIVGLIVVIIHAVVILLSPAASGYLIDKTLASKSIADLVLGVSLFCIAIIGQPFFGFFKDIIYMNIVWNLNSSNSYEVFEKILYLPITYYEKTQRGEIISRLTNDIKELSSFAARFFTVLVKNIVLTVLIIGCMFYISSKITIMVFFLLILFFCINKRLNNKLENLSMKIAEYNDSVYSKVSQTITEIISIKSFGCEEHIAGNYQNVLNDMVRANKKRELLAIIIRNFSTLVIMISLSLIYFIGCVDVLNGELSVGNVISLGLYYQLVMNPLFEIVGSIIDWNNIKPIFKRFEELIHQEEENRQCKEIERSSLKYINDIHFHNVKFAFDSKVVLDDISFNMPNKGYIGIVGKSGEGKSTLIKLMIGLYTPQSGKISIGDYDVDEIGINVLRDKIAFVPQDIVLFNTSINENFFVANKELSHHEIIEWCKQVNMHEKIMSTEKQYDTIINEIPNISGGERQRIGIAMALAKRASIILLDEPTSALDPKNEELIVQRLKKVAEEKLVIVISHREQTLKYADKLYSLQNGKLIETASRR